MSQLDENLLAILQEKKEKIIPENIKAGVTIFNTVGEFEGEILDTSDATATAEDMMLGVTAYVNGEKIEGTIAPIEDMTIKEASQVYVPEDGSNTLLMTSVTSERGILDKDVSYQIRANSDQVSSAIGLAPDLIRSGANILGVEGTYDSNPEEYNAKFIAPEGVTSGLTAASMLMSVESIETNNLTSASSLFANCWQLKSLPEMNLNKAISTAYMCNNCTNLIYTPNISIPVCTDMSYMFANCHNIDSINVSGITKRNILMTGAFQNCYSLKTVPNLQWNLANNNFNDVFANCYNLTNVTLNTNLYASKSYSHMNNVFYNCTNLQYAAGLNGRPYADNYAMHMYRTFFNCTNLLEVRDCSWYYGTYNGTFQNCTNLIGFNNVNAYISASAAGFYDTFHNCYSLVNLPNNFTAVRIPLATNASNTFGGCSNLVFPNKMSFTYWAAGGGTMNHIFRNCNQIVEMTINCEGSSSSYRSGYAQYWFENCANLERVTFTNFSYVTPTRMFANCPKMKNLDMVGFSGGWGEVFYNCWGITDLNVSLTHDNGTPYPHWTISGRNICRNCINLQNTGTMDMTHGDFYWAFSDCINLRNLDGLNIYDVVWTMNMFENCSNLTTINCIRSFNSTNLYLGVNGMVKGCYNLTDLQELDLTNKRVNSTYPVAPFGDYTTIVNNGSLALWKLVNFGGFGALGTMYNTFSNLNSYRRIDIVGAPNLSYQSLINITSNLANLKTVLNVAEGTTFNSWQYLYMEANQYAKLSETDLTDISNKGWLINVQTINAETMV